MQANAVSKSKREQLASLSPVGEPIAVLLCLSRGVSDSEAALTWIF